MIQMLYVGSRRGDFRVVAQPTRTQYHIPGQGGLVELDQTGAQGVRPEDVAWFRSVNQGRDFKVVDPPAPAPPVQAPPPIPRPEPVPTAPSKADSEAWAPDIMEAPEREIADWDEAPEPVMPEITDAAQALAEAHGLDWSQLEGSGAGGKILLSDVRAAIG